MAHNPPTPSTAADLHDAIEHYGPWFHNLRLHGIETAPDHPLGDHPRRFFEEFAHALPHDLRGWSVLDVGCNAGFYSFEMKRRGAARVVGIDADERYLAQARLASRALEIDVEFRQQSVFDLRPNSERYDLVLFLGVLYHLRHPLLALDLLRRSVVGRLLVFQTMLRGEDTEFTPEGDYPISDHSPFATPGYPKMHFVEARYAGDPTNWWLPNGACAQAMLRSAGFIVLDRPHPEVFVCEIDQAVAPPELPGPFEGEPA